MVKLKLAAIISACVFLLIGISMIGRAVSYSPQTVFASDDFNRPDGPLGTASDGGAWTKVSFASGTATITGGRVRSNSTNVNIYRHSAVPASADYTVKADIFANNLTSGVRIGPAVRVDQFGNCYNAYYLNQRFEIRKETGGTATSQPISTLIKFTGTNSHVPTVGQTYVVELTATGNQLSLKVDGIEVIAPFVDSSISAKGQPGLRASVNTSNFLLDNWEARDSSAPVPTPTPTPSPSPSPSPTPTPSGNDIVLDSGTKRQTMAGWEFTAQAGQSDFPDWNSYKHSLVDQAVADGLDRARLQVRTRVESPAPNASVSTNDNTDPFIINPAGFQWNDNNGVNVQAELINLMRAKLAEQGETLYVNACRVDFQSADQLHSKVPEEDAELWEATFLYLWNTFGWVPDTIEVLLEADKTSNIDWTHARLNASILETQRRLATYGWHPKFILPSTTACRKMLPDGSASFLNALDWYNKVIAVDSGVVPYITEFSFHRYGGTNIQCSPADVAIMNDAAAANGHSISMLEKIGADYKTLHDDVKNGAAAWQEYALAYDNVDDGAEYYLVNHTTHAVTIASRMKFLRQYFKYVRRGAVRIDAQSGNVNFDPVAFINTNGKYVVVIKAAAGGGFNVVGLPAGTYGIKYTTSTQYNIDLPDQTIGAGGIVMTAIPAAGVITIYGK